MKFFISNINLQKSKWFSLEFSSLGFLGKLLRNNDLQDFANFLLMFYWEQPGDLLFGYMKKIKTQFSHFAADDTSITPASRISLLR
jgi:hypothetical protein